MDGETREMPKYSCHKEVHALKIDSLNVNTAEGLVTITPADEGYGPFTVDIDYLKKHEPQIGGYFVVYKGGYKSYSPAKAFEEGYRRIDS